MDILMPVETEEQYKEALRRVSELEGDEPAPDTVKGREFASLLKLIDAYEEEAYDEIDSPAPSVVVEEHMKRLNLSPAELSEKVEIPLPRLSKIIDGERLPSRREIETLSEFFEIPAKFLIETDQDSASSE